jgi:glutamate synthase domain-containing protein 2/glutamate synthase domain-containing protein 1/glutamate synthase domain-containing protein 3
MRLSMRSPHDAGLYSPTLEHDGCGVAFVARPDGKRSHETMRLAVNALESLEHRGAEGADAESGDGAGILIPLPDEFLRARLDSRLPPAGRFGVAVCFLPRDGRGMELEHLLQRTVEGEGQRVVGWRDVPVADAALGLAARRCAPAIRQLFVAAADNVDDQASFERKLYVIRRLVEREVGDEAVIPSFSSRTIVYKGMLRASRLAEFYPDLRDERLTAKLALVHSRFSTNTLPSWELAHPYRLIAHNGEVNTLQGNRNWMRARESRLSSELFGDDLEKVLPAIRPGGSDSAAMDNVLELLMLAGRTLPHALMMIIPEAHENRTDLPDELKGFYDFHAGLLEPWDGPAAVGFTDGRVIGARLDRNGLRPGRWAVTTHGWVLFSSEAGTVPIPPEQIVRKGRLKPGRTLLIDTHRGEVLNDREPESRIAARRPYAEWAARRGVPLTALPAPAARAPPEEALRTRQLAFGYTQEDLRVLIAPMAEAGKEPIGSMGNDAVLAVLSDREPSLFSYFKQLFAQVTNPAIDPVRESVVMSLRTTLGSQENLLDEHPHFPPGIHLEQPIVRDVELEKLRAVSGYGLRSSTIDTTWPAVEGPEGMQRALERTCREASECISENCDVLILSDRRVGRDRMPIPSLLAVGAVHHHLVREGTRLRTGLVIESGDPREVHHVACLVGYGANAVNPYLMLESARDLVSPSEEAPSRPGGRLDAGLPPLSAERAEEALIGALGKGLLKILSKMGVSTVQSYCGAQLFEAVGLERELVERYFTGTVSRIGGVGLDVLAEEAVKRHRRAYPAPEWELLPVGGLYAWRRDGEFHMWNPETVSLLQDAVREGAGPEAYEEFSRRANEDAARRAALRGLLKLRQAGNPVPLDEVEPAEEIVKRFSTGGMSLGALSPEAHETLAVAMNRIGAKSNTGEGGEDPRRNVREPGGDLRRSAIKQVASGRFGVTIGYLVNAEQLQIKISQGSKPGEGGQLPGHKVDRYIAKLRFSTPGVELISPPPHHDIYSIEDLKQLIYDLRCANPAAEISVKLAAELGVGTVAAGVAKANADHVVIAGHDGGTGASPLSSIQSAGVPWELGLAETQQTLIRSGLRSRVAVQVDGQMKTGRDVVVAALLGADEMGFSTAPLIATGCIMMRVCHLNTCPVGVASQDPELRKRFQGTPEQVIRYLFLIAEEARRLMSSLGVARLDDLIGRGDLLERDEAIDHWKAQRVDLAQALALPAAKPDVARHKTRPQEMGLESALDHDLIAAARPALESGDRVQLHYPIRNVNRAVGGLLSNAIVRAHGDEGLPEGTIDVVFDGSAGQSFGAWLARGVTFTLRGEANDYAGKGLSGGILVLLPPPEAAFPAEENVIVGNTVLYGATGGRAFFRGLAGERFAIRNSGADAVVEGVGDHGCEYMTGGRVVVLGPTGQNFAAGMSGGVAYVLDEEDRFARRCNPELVGFDELTPDDEAELYALIAEHAASTGSSVARRVLERFDEVLPRFVKVMPHDYKRVLAELAAEARGEVAA